MYGSTRELLKLSDELRKYKGTEKLAYRRAVIEVMQGMNLYYKIVNGITVGAYKE